MQEGLILEWSSPHFAPDSISLYLDLWQGMAPGGVLIHCRDSSGPAYLPLWGILRSQEEQARPEVEDWLGWPGLAAVWTASPEVVGGVGMLAGASSPGEPAVVHRALRN